MFVQKCCFYAIFVNMNISVLCLNACVFMSMRILVCVCIVLCSLSSLEDVTCVGKDSVKGGKLGGGQHSH